MGNNPAFDLVLYASASIMACFFLSLFRSLASYLYWEWQWRRRMREIERGLLKRPAHRLNPRERAYAEMMGRLSQSKLN